MIIAGVDIATTSGFAVLEADRLVHAEAFRPNGTMDAEIFHGFREWFEQRIATYNVSHVAIEQPLPTTLERDDPSSPGAKRPMMSMQSYLRLYGLRAHAVELCLKLGIDCEECHQSTWRKAFLGTGRGDKDMALAQCRLLRWRVTSKDAAEACGIAWWLSGHLRLTQMARPGELFARTA